MLAQPALSAPVQGASCHIDEGELKRLTSGQHGMVMAFRAGEREIPFSGNANFDRALGRQLVKLAMSFTVGPGFMYMDDVNGMNAAASSATRVPGTAGTVLFGIRLLRDLLTRGTGGDMAVLGVCAHEFGHIHQYFSGDFHALRSAHPTVKLVELQADFLAGYFVAAVKLERSHVELRTFLEFLFRSGSYDSAHPDFHGTPQERVRAAERGMSVAREGAPFRKAAAEGRQYVLLNFR
ncbi:hypothetical protein [Ramlibacter sp.]|uniref:hypothetical protein n=1 Tax=Ramlibacter sp. TaxID=1917967 RepID=UPI0035B36192